MTTAPMPPLVKGGGSKSRRDCPCPSFLRAQRLLLEEKLAKISDFCLMRWKPSYYTSSTANAVPLPLKGKALANSFLQQPAKAAGDVVHRFVADELQNVLIPQKGQLWGEVLICKIKLQFHTKVWENMQPIAHIPCPGCHASKTFASLLKSCRVLLNTLFQRPVFHHKAAAAHENPGQTGHRAKYICGNCRRFPVANIV